MGIGARRAAWAGATAAMPVRAGILPAPADHAAGGARAAPAVGAPPAAEPGRWESLMAQAQAGDQGAYATLLHELLPLLRRIAATADAAETEARVQDLLLVIHALRHSYDPARPLAAWVAAIGAHRGAAWRGRPAGRAAGLPR